jgi:hypothetical protein
MSKRAEAERKAIAKCALGPGPLRLKAAYCKWVASIGPDKMFQQYYAKLSV